MMDMPVLPNLPLNPLDALGLGGGDGNAHDEKYELTAGPYVNGQLRVVDFEGDEAANDLYWYRVRFKTRVPYGVIYRALGGQPACLKIKRSGQEPKLVQGLVVRVGVLGVSPDDRARGWLLYELVIAPRLWLLTQRRTVRQFHQKTPKEIIEIVLREVGISSKELNWKIGDKKPLPKIPFVDQKDDEDKKYPKLPLVYQRDETDYEFFRRVLSEAGIIFVFEHASGTIDKLLPGAGAIAGAIGSVADMIGGAAADAVGEVGAATKMVTTLTFIDNPNDLPAVQEMALVNDLVAQGLSSLVSAVGADKALKDAASAIGGEKAAGLVSMDVVNPAGAIQYHDEGAGTDKERIIEFGFRQELRPKRVRIIERDVFAASNWVGTAESKVVKAGLDLDIGVGIGPGGPSLQGRAAINFDVDSPVISPKILRHELYQVNSTLRFYADPEERIKMELERERVDRLQGSGRSDCPALSGGYRFRLEGYPVDELNIEYTIVSLHCEGRTEVDEASGERQAVYENAFTCVPAHVRPLPPRSQRPRLSAEVAEVVSQEGERMTANLDTNHVGGVKLRYPWDLNEEEAERGNLSYGEEANSAPYHPVLQLSVDDRCGIQCLPREGTTVVSDYFEGQGERSFVTGGLYDEVNRLPFREDIQHQKIGIVSRSLPADGNDGSSEVSIDARRGGELVHVRSNRDLDVLVRNESRIDIGAMASARVAGNTYLEVDGSHNTRIAGTEQRRVEGDKNEIVAGLATTTFEKSSKCTVKGDLSQQIDGGHNTTVMGQSLLTVSQSRTTGIADEDVLTIGRRESISVGTGQEHAESDKYVHGTCRLGAKDIVIEGERSVIIRCHGTELKLTPKSLALLAKTIQGASKEFEISGDGPSLRLDRTAQILAKEITLQAVDARLQLNDSAKLTSNNVALGKSTSASSAAKDSSLSPTAKAPLFCPYAESKYVMQMGSITVEGTTDSEGRAFAEIPEDVSTIRWKVCKGEFPEGPWVVYDLSVEEHSDVTSLLGAQQQLRNLGFHAGEPTGKMDLCTFDALHAFQRQHGLECSGDLDSATQAKLSELAP